jgi:hypothetical protein
MADFGADSQAAGSAEASGAVSFRRLTTSPIFIARLHHQAFLPGGEL